MLYTKPILEVSWADVVVFCEQQIPEGTYLDYKESFPRYLEKTIAAMANTFGGLIIIGVEENDENKPLLPLSGIEFVRGLSERVTSIILSNIVPPVFPEIQVCPNNDSSSAFVVIRVPQSHQSPHAIAGNRKVYIRTADMNKPEDLATVEDISWLRNSRKKSTLLREQVYKKFDTRHRHYFGQAIELMLELGGARTPILSGILSMSICPTFPREIVANPPDLLNINQEISVEDYYGTADRFPPRDTMNRTGLPTLLQDGITFADYTSTGDRFLYTEINSIGFYGYRQPLSYIESEKYGESKKLLRAGELFTRIDEFIESALKFLEFIGYWGIVDLTMSLNQFDGMGMIFDWLDTPFVHDVPHGFCPDEEVHHKDAFLGRDLLDNRESIILNYAQRFCWAFGIDLLPEHLESCWGKLNRPQQE